MDNKSSVYMLCLLMVFLICESSMAERMPRLTDVQYHEQISQLWNQKKAKYLMMVKNSDKTPYNLYNIQLETNNLLRYASYYQKYSLLDELCDLYLHALNTLTETDQYLFPYYPGSPRLSIHPLDKKYRMWIDDQKPLGEESILVSSQFLFVLSDTVGIIADINKEERTAIMKEALEKFIPLLLEHYNRWIYNTPGPFQVRCWGCRYDGEYVLGGMNHLDFLNKKLEKNLGNGKSPRYCNAVTDTDMWIIAGVTNILAVYQKEKASVPITPEEYKNFLDYIKTGVSLLKSRFTYTKLKDFNGNNVTGALLDAGAWDEHLNFSYVGYEGEGYPRFSQFFKLKYPGKGTTGWDLSHARRLVNVFDTLMKSKDLLGLDFPTKSLMENMANQLVYATFNRDLQKPLFTNFMDGTNGWYRLGYSDRSGFGYGPWDMSLYVFEGGYGFWSRYNFDIKTIFSGFLDMIESKDPSIRKHVVTYYEMNHWSQYVRVPDRDFINMVDPNTQDFFIQFLPSLCFMYDTTKDSNN